MLQFVYFALSRSNTLKRTVSVIKYKKKNQKVNRREW